MKSELIKARRKRSLGYWLLAWLLVAGLPPVKAFSAPETATAAAFANFDSALISPADTSKIRLSDYQPTLSAAPGSAICAGTLLIVTNATDCPGCVFEWNNDLPAASIVIQTGTRGYALKVTSAQGLVKEYPEINITGLEPGQWLGNSSDWTSPSNWCGGSPPRTSDVIIPSGTSAPPVIDRPVGVRSLTIEAGAQLILADHGTLSVLGDLENDGTISAHADATVRLAGTSIQRIGAMTVGNLMIDGAGAELTAPVTITGKLTFSRGNLYTSDTAPLTFSATGSMTAELAQSRIVGPAFASPRAVGNGRLELLGLALEAGTDDLGFVTLSRSPYSVQVNGSPTISHVWSIEADNAPASGRRLTLTWTSADDNGNDLRAMKVFSRSPFYEDWQEEAMPQNVTNSRSLTVETTHFSLWTVGDGIEPLPVSLVQFDGTREGQRVELRWATLNEKNNSGFDIERSTDGRHFKRAAFIRGHGTSTWRHDYAWKEDSKEAAYYRLRQIDYDGKSTLSPTVFVPARAAGPVSLLPNPSRGQVFVNGEDLQNAQFELINLNGQQVLSRTITAGQAVELHEMPRGIYQYRVTTAANVQQGRLVLE